MTLTEDLLAYWIACEKQVRKPPSAKHESDLGYWRNSFDLVASEDSQLVFKGFIRINKEFDENYSVGIGINHPKLKGTLTLLRCNGVHDSGEIYEHHQSPHIHYLTANDFNAGLRSQRRIEMTDAYSNYKQAIHFFVQEVNVIVEDQAKYFQPLWQQNLFDQT